MLTIKAANEAVLAMTKQPNPLPSNRGAYVKLTGVQQAHITRYALSHSNQTAIHHYSKEYCTDLQESFST